MKGGRGFSKAEHICRHGEFQLLFRNGKKVGIEGARLFYARNGTDTNRIGFPLPRGYGRAVDRNKSRRLSRETYRFFKPLLNTGYDMLLLVYPGKDSFNSRCEQFKMLCQKAGLLKK